MAKAKATTKKETAPKEAVETPKVELPVSDRYCITGERGYNSPGVPGSNQVSVHDTRNGGRVVASFNTDGAARLHAQKLNRKDLPETTVPRKP